jgi:hypothetical protein
LTFSVSYEIDITPCLICARRNGKRIRYPQTQGELTVLSRSRGTRGLNANRMLARPAMRKIYAVLSQLATLVHSVGSASEDQDHQKREKKRLCDRRNLMKEKERRKRKMRERDVYAN